MKEANYVKLALMYYRIEGGWRTLKRTMSNTDVHQDCHHRALQCLAIKEIHASSHNSVSTLIILLLTPAHLHSSALHQRDNNITNYVGTTPQRHIFGEGHHLNTPTT